MKIYTNKLTDPNTRIRLGVGVIIARNEGEILLEKRSDNGLWGLPGGSVVPGESVINAAVREVKEETNLDICITGMLGVYSDPADSRIVKYPDNVVHLVDCIFKAKIISGKLQMSHESLDLRFFFQKDFPVDIAPPAIQVIQDYFEGKSVVFC